ncbi:substrate-binding periplasmic protein [Undibacterium sp. JH2W]|uniref:substrate-binding periplasmic protein n=1 Tax=Undibacterium sp. JH2W TaxID=3413037 RepID=UPI003BF10E4F
MVNLSSLVLSLLLQALSLPPAVPEAERMQIALTQQDYPPLIVYGVPPSGLLTDIVRESFKLSKVDASFVAVPNNRAIVGVMQDFYDGSYGWAHSPERDVKLLYSNKPIYFLRIGFFQRAGEEFNWVKLADLSGMKIGITQGNYYSEEFARLVATGVLGTDSAPSDVSNFKKLLIGRIDLFPIDFDSGQYLLKNHFSAAERQKIQMQGKPISVVPVYLVIRRNLLHAKELMTRFDRGFQQLSDTGQLARLSDVYKQQLHAQP